MLKRRIVLIADSLYQVKESIFHSQRMREKMTTSKFSKRERRTILKSLQPMATRKTSYALSRHNDFKTIYNIFNLMIFYHHDKYYYRELQTDSISWKIILFNDRCEQATVTNIEKPHEYSIISRGLVLLHYFKAVQSRSPNEKELFQATHLQFITAEHIRSLV